MLTMIETPGLKALNKVRSEVNRKIGDPEKGNLNEKVNAWLDTIESDLLSHARALERADPLESMAKLVNNQTELIVRGIRDHIKQLQGEGYRREDRRELKSADDDENGSSARKGH
jgi:hypothetical protein